MVKGKKIRSLQTMAIGLKTIPQHTMAKSKTIDPYIRWAKGKKTRLLQTMAKDSKTRSLQTKTKVPEKKN